MFFNKALLVVCLLVLSAMTGCASFPQKELAKVGKMPDVSQYKNKPSVYIGFKFLRGNPGDPKAVEVNAVKDKIMPMLEKSINEMGLFSSVTFDEFKKDSTNYTIKLSYYNHGDVGPAAISGFITGLTLFIIPGAATDNYTLVAQIIDRNGQVVKAYQNKDSITTWMGWIFVPVMGNTPEKALQATLDNQLREVLKKIIENGQIQYSFNEYLNHAVMFN